MEIELKITEKDNKEIYEFLKYCKDKKMMLNRLKDAVNLYEFSNYETGELPGYLTPERLKEKKLKEMNEEQLLKLRKLYEDDLILFAQEYHPDEVDCGIMRGPDNEYWFIDEGSRLGYITLYGQYIKVVDEVLKERSDATK